MTQISLPVFSSGTNRKLHNISVIPKLVKTIATNLHLSKASGSDCITVVLIKNSQPELSDILPELFNVCLKETFFPDCWKVLLVFPVFKMLEKGVRLKTTVLLVFFLRLVKSLKNL